MQASLTTIKVETLWNHSLSGVPLLCVFSTPFITGTDPLAQRSFEVKPILRRQWPLSMSSRIFWRPSCTFGRALGKLTAGHLSSSISHFLIICEVTKDYGHISFIRTKNGNIFIFFALTWTQCQAQWTKIKVLFICTRKDHEDYESCMRLPFPVSYCEQWSRMGFETSFLFPFDLVSDPIFALLWGDLSIGCNENVL